MINNLEVLSKSAAKNIQSAQQKSVSEATAQVIYHGSSLSFSCPKCCHSTRTNEVGAIDWEGEAVFATFDRRIALTYTCNRNVDGYCSGVDLRTEISKDKRLAFTVFGGVNKEDAMNKLFGTGAEYDSIGYIYKMNAQFFHHEKGLGVMERISRTPEKSGFLVAIETINRRKEIDEYIKKGLLEIDWRGPELTSITSQTTNNATTNVSNSKSPSILTQYSQNNSSSNVIKIQNNLKTRCCCF